MIAHLARKNRTLNIWLTLTAAMFGISAAIFVAYVDAEKTVERANEDRLRALQLAEELRNSSESLTRMARNYIATGNQAYEKNYVEIVDIREGRRPRLKKYANYWALAVYGDTLAKEFGDRASFLELARQARLSDAEYALLDVAKSNSDSLVTTETEAMRLFESGGPNAAENELRAKSILYGDSFDSAKLGILQPISQLTALVDARTVAAVEQGAVKAWMFRLIFVGAILMGLCMMAGSYRSLRTLLGAPPLEIFEQIAQLGCGDFTTLGKQRPPAPNTVMSWLLDAQKRLADLVSAQDKAKELLANQNSALWTNNHILKKLSDDAPLAEILEELVCRVETDNPGVLCAIQLVDGTALVPAAAPHLPDAWKASKIPIAEGSGSCGAAAYRGEVVIVESALTCPYGERCREVAEQCGLGSCWVQPFKSSHGDVSGTLILYHKEAGVPSDREREQIESYAKFAALAVERSRLNKALRLSQEHHRLIAEHSNDVIWLADITSLRLTYVSPSVERRRGWTPEEVLGRPLPVEALPAATLARLTDKLNEPGWTDHRETFEIELPHRDGHLIPFEVEATLLRDEAGKAVQILGINRDISERKAAEEAIRQMAFYDELTNLPNRRLLEDRIQTAIHRARREGLRMALLFIDLDNFKLINDEFGHEVGDWLLQQAAIRMQDCARASDTVARFGGDEFIVLLPDSSAARAATTVAEKIRAALEQPFVGVDGRKFQISSSIGVAFFPDHGANSRDLLRLGDEAMYHTKKAGRNAVHVYAVEGA